MADLKVTGRMKVKSLKKEFLKELGLSIRIYDGRSFADDHATLASIKKGDSKGGEFSIKKNMKVGNLEKRILDEYGIKTQIAGKEDTYLCKNELTLAAAKKADEKYIAKQEKKKTNEEESDAENENDFDVINAQYISDQIIDRINALYDENQNIGDSVDRAEAETIDAYDLEELMDEEGIGTLDEVIGLYNLSEDKKLKIMKTKIEYLEKYTNEKFMDIIESIDIETEIEVNKEDSDW